MVLGSKGSGWNLNIDEALDGRVSDDFLLS